MPLESVQRWINREQKAPPQPGLAALAALKQILEEHCAFCGRTIEVEIMQWSGRKYHPDCCKEELSQGIQNR